jgi:hypothetical protein
MCSGPIYPCVLPFEIVPPAVVISYLMTPGVLYMTHKPAQVIRPYRAATHYAELASAQIKASGPYRRTAFTLRDMALRYGPYMPIV